MTCRACLERLSPHHDGALSAAEEAEVSAHLASCEACHREWETFQRAMEAIAGAAPPMEPADLAWRVEGAWRASREATGGWVVAVVIYVAAALGTVLALRSC